MRRSGLKVLLVAALALGFACKSSSSGGGGSGGAAAAAGSGQTTGTGGAVGTSGSSSSSHDAGPVFDAGSDPARNKVQAGQLCARLATIRCAAEAVCCKMPARDNAACTKAIDGSCKASLRLDEVAADPLVAFDANAASTAFAELEHRASTCDPSLAAWAVSREGFSTALIGTRGKGDACMPMGGVNASPPVLGAALASCRFGEGLACLPTSDTSWTCAPRNGAAGRCFTSLNCTDGLFCDNPMSTFMGVCTARKAAAADCTDNDQCTSFLCKSGSCVASDDVQALYCAK